MGGERRSSFLRWLVLILCLAVLAFGSVSTLRVAPAPQLELEVAQPAIGRRTPVTVTVESGGRGLSGLRLELLQGDRVHEIAKKTHRPRRAWEFWGPRALKDAVQAEVGPETAPGLREGEATLRATAHRAGTWLRSPEPVVRELTLPVRLVPPTLSVLSSQHYVTQGGSEVVLYRAGATSVRDGVRAGPWFFPGFPLPGGGPQDRFALFAVPYDVGDRNQLRLVAADDVGNQAEVAFLDQFAAKPFATDRIELTDAFMGKVVPEITSHTPDLPDRGSPLENYLQINRDLRQKNAEDLKRLAADSRREFLWNESFLPMPNAKVMSAFADRRTYVYEGRDVDQQYHLGFDLAVTQHAPMPAANRGVVVLAEYFGIYGNAVVIDHGFGLLSLYGHLSSTDVTKGQEVARGQIIGRTGDTGLAGGDHLHFTMVLHGLPVNPNEWWDAHWIRDRLARKLGGVLPFKG
jgi:murein DD-endopeptidase MepM/ murein hydrolase activator NlpD